MADPKIDFVITWVDGNDPDWIRERAKYQPGKNSDNSVQRYRDFGLLPFWFRGIEKFAPWVNRVHLVTCGHFPLWLNTDHPKLHIVKHRDYLPPEALPTFNSNAIELSMHHIPGLSEQFVYFNDDTFLLRPVRESDFFRNGFPVDKAILSPVIADPDDNGIAKTQLNNMYAINRNFEKKEVIRKNLSGFLTLRNGVQLLRTVCLLPWHHLPGFYIDHLPVPYRKQTFTDVWNCEREILEDVTYHQFRDCSADVNHWLMRCWQFCTGTFFPDCSKRGLDLDISSEHTPEIIQNQKYKMVCMNDKINSESKFNTIQLQLNTAFSQILPERSEFEKE